MSIFFIIWRLLVTIRDFSSGTSRRSPNILALNTRLFYDLIRLKHVVATRVFVDLVSNYDLVLHRISSLSLQTVDVLKEPILCMLTTLKHMIHLVIISFV